MSDVYVAFVRDDQSYAEALAVALQGSGFTVSRSSSVVEAIGQCSAIVVLWTPAAARSKLFIDAADRAFRAGKMVLARMGQDPLPPMFTGVEIHSLARWSGDPESPEIDSIVFAVNRLVSRGRGRPGAPGAESPPEPTSSRGVVHQFPGGSAAVRAPREATQAYPMPQPTDPLTEEAAYWRRIQNATDINEFYAYLDRYGRNGTFAELAEARVRALSQRPAPRAPGPGMNPGGMPMNSGMGGLNPAMGGGMTGMPPQPMPAPMPQPMQAPPINRGGFNMSPPVARQQPAARTEAPPPPRSRAVDPPEDERRSGGGGRAFMLLIFVAIMLGGGYYIYSQLRGPEPTAISSEDSIENWTPPEGSPADPEPAAGDDRQASAGSARAPVPPRPAPDRRRVAATEPEPEPPPPAPVFRTLPAAPAPATAPPPTVSEAANDLQRDVGPALPAPTPVQVAPAPPPAPAVQPASVRPRWARRPTERDLRDAYPAAASRLNVEGRVVLDCLIGTDLAIRCRARSETPAGYGFATAALRVAQEFRAAPTLQDGRPAAGERAQVTLVFKPE
jgi:hypothetical protein